MKGDTMVEESKQGELFGKPRGPSDRIPLAIIYLSFAFLFSLIAFLSYMLWDFGIAGRVVLFLTLILVLVHVAIFIAKQLLSQFPWR
jgi:hypothetical protein